jgi:hypothetical protein
MLLGFVPGQICVWIFLLKPEAKDNEYAGKLKHSRHSPWFGAQIK